MIIEAAGETIIRRKATTSVIEGFLLQVNGSKTVIELIDGKALYIKKGKCEVFTEQADSTAISMLTGELDSLLRKLVEVIERLH